MQWKAFLAACLVTGGLMAATPPAPTTRPVGGGALEVRAVTAFNNKQYSLALPMLQSLADEYRAQPDKKEKLATVEEEIRVCQKAIEQAKASGAIDAQAAATDRPVGTTPEARKAIPFPKPGEVTDLLIKDLGNFDYDMQKGGNIPDDIKRLNGTKFRTRGFMIPLDQAENINEFALVPSLFACCFGQPPQIQHTLVVHCPKGKAVSYYPDEIVVEGTLKVDEKKDDGYIISVFEIDAQSVKPAPK